MKIRITTKFDCTTTGTTGHYRSQRVPYRDARDNLIEDEKSWTRSRNQQRNYETLIQLLSLRTQLVNITAAEFDGELWWFEIESDRDDVFSDNFASLKLDCENVPMIVDLGETTQIEPALDTSDSGANIWFMEL